MPQADRRKRALNRIRCADVAPIGGREIVISQQAVAVFLQAIGRLGVFAFEGLEEQVERFISLAQRGCLPDLVQHSLGLRLDAFR